MEDVAPELLKKIQEEFAQNVERSSILKKANEKIMNGTATYAEANEYAIEVGNILAKAYGDNISADDLPDGKMHYNIANRIITPTMQNNYKMISEASAQVQKSLNDAAGIGINAIQPEVNQNRIEGIVNRVSSAENYDDVAWILQEPVVNFSQSIIDETIKANAEFHAEAGLEAKIVRKLAGGCCEWCSRLAGTYVYPDVPDDVYRRHQRCRCTVDYIPDKSKKAQNVWTKEWKDIEKRKEVGLEKEHELTLKKGTNVTTEYEHKKSPGQGKIIYDSGYDMQSHPEEIAAAEWIHTTLGGDIKLLTEATADGIKMPDYIWNNKYWELKSTTTEKSANSAIRKGLTQIADNPGGIMLNYANDVDMQKVIDVIEKRINVSKDSSISLDIMVVVKKKLKIAIRY